MLVKYDKRTSYFKREDFLILVPEIIKIVIEYVTTSGNKFSVLNVP